MLRYCLQLFPDASAYFRPLIITLAVIGIVYGATLAIGQTDVMRLIAYTSISHFGFIILGIFVMTSQGQSGSTLYMVNHGISTAALFLIAGFLVSRRGTRLISAYGGVQKVAPVLAGTFLVSGLATLSLPGLAPFISEFLVLIGTFTRYPAFAVIASVALVLSAIYILWLYQRMMTGPITDGTDTVRDLRPRELLVVAPLIALLIGLGTGHTAAALDRLGYRQIDVAEFAPGIVAAADCCFRGLNESVLSNPRVKVYLEDGRNVLLTRRQSYDLITIESPVSGSLARRTSIRGSSTSWRGSD
jgi:NADH:ubiquinone oxidoreductase subunit 4 (subunit M)